MKTILYAFVATIILQACNSKKEITKDSLKASIDSVENVLYSTAATAPINVKNGQLAVNAYVAYAQKYPEDSASANYLFKAAEVASAVKMTQPALNYFSKFVKLYPNHPKAATALFLQAFICENDLNELGRANSLYTDVIKKYPNSPFAKDAEACIANLGKSPEEMIKEFEEKNKKENQ